VALRYKRTHERGPDTCDLYRARSINGDLLYVGISVDALTRFATHMRLAQWPDYVATLEIERYNSRAMAERAEKHAINAENPIFNKGSVKPDRDKAPCSICQRTKACAASNCPKRQFRFAPIIYGENIRAM
jgi:hypothetical protein